MPSTALQGRRVLIVEDDGLLALELTEMLADFGCTVVDVAFGLARALAAAEFHELDVAVLDVNLAHEKAFRVAHMLMAREVPFLFATGAGRDAIPAAFDGVTILAKPFSGPQLEAALLAILPPDDLPKTSGPPREAWRT